MNSRIIWVTAIVFAMAHVAISICFVLLAAATSDMPEWGMHIAACYTTYPLAAMGFYDDITSGLSVASTVAVLIVIGALVYGVLGACVGWAINRVKNRV
jgi:hypothetical protein